MGAIIVFPGTKITAGTIKMNVQRLWYGDLSEEACDSREIGISHPRSVITLRVNCIVTQDGYRSVPIPKAH